MCGGVLGERVGERGRPPILPANPHQVHLFTLHVHSALLNIHVHTLLRVRTLSLPLPHASSVTPHLYSLIAPERDVSCG